MSRNVSVAFLRAINVGGHTVKMEDLRRHFESFGFLDVETFIASGNVMFTAAAGSPAVQERVIAAGLQRILGYEVAAFVRTSEQLGRIATMTPFAPSDMDAAVAYNIAFLADEPDAQAERKIQALTSEIDRFAVHEREVYWLCRKKQSESKFSNAVLEKTLGVKSTMRTISTVKKIAEKIA